MSVLKAEWEQQAKPTDKKAGKGKGDDASDDGFFLSGNEMFLLSWLLKPDDSVTSLLEPEEEATGR